METIGRYYIWLSGSKRRIARMVYRNSNKYYVTWYGKKTEVMLVETSDGNYYRTVQYL